MRLLNRKVFCFSIGFVLLASLVRADDSKITWLGHAAFKVTSRLGEVLLIDPWITNPKAPKGVTFQHVEAILITHGHSDHVGEAFELAKKFNAPIIAAMELTTIAQKRGVKMVLPIYPSGTVKVRGWTITAVEAVHASSCPDGDTVLYAGVPMGFIVAEFGVGSFYHAGDTGVFNDMALISEMYSPNMALLPIGGVYTMKPREAAYAARMLQVKTIIPMHFGTFPALSGTPAELQTEMTRLGVPSTIRELTPGKEVRLKDLY